MKYIKYIRPFIDQKMYNYGTTLKNAIHLAKLYGVQDNNRRCPICGKYTFGQDWICQRCGWQQDTLVYTDDEYSDSNYCSINEYREVYKNVGKNKPLKEYWNYRNNNM